MFGRSKTVKPSEIEELTRTIAELRGEVRALTTLKDRTEDLTRLREQISDLEINKAKIIADQQERERATQHKVGLLQDKQKQDAAHQERMNTIALREAKASVREENLTEDRRRFTEQMEFVREQIAGEIDRFTKLQEQLLERLPTIEVNLEGPAQTAPARSSRRASSKED